MAELSMAPHNRLPVTSASQDDVKVAELSFAGPHNLQPGECLLAVDVLNCGGRVTAVGLERVWRVSMDGPLSFSQASHLSQDHRDYHSAVDEALDHQLRLGERGLFHGYCRVYVSSDNGLHFTSTLQGIDMVSVESHHAYNLCDNAGVSSLRDHVRLCVYGNHACVQCTEDVVCDFCSVRVYACVCVCMCVCVCVHTRTHARTHTQQV